MSSSTHFAAAYFSKIDNKTVIVKKQLQKQGSHKLWKSWKTCKITKKSSMHGKIHGIWEKTEYSWKNHGILWNNLTKPPIARKLAVFTASFLATGGFKF